MTKITIKGRKAQLNESGMFVFDDGKPYDESRPELQFGSISESYPLESTIPKLQEAASLRSMDNFKARMAKINLANSFRKAFGFSGQEAALCAGLKQDTQLDQSKPEFWDGLMDNLKK